MSFEWIGVRNQGTERTVGLVVLLHVEKRVVVDVARKVDVGSIEAMSAVWHDEEDAMLTRHASTTGTAGEARVGRRTGSQKSILLVLASSETIRTHAGVVSAHVPIRYTP